MHRPSLTTALVLAAALFLAGCVKKEAPAPPPAVKSGPILSADGVRIVFESRGSGDPALVFVHGWTGSSHSWDAQMDHFSKTHRVVAIDLAGHGASGGNRQDFTVQAFAADVATVVNYLGLEDVILVGHSLGGPVIAAAAPLLTGKVRALVGADTFDGVEQTWSDKQIDAWLSPMRANYPVESARFIRSMLPKNADSALVGRLTRGASQANPRMALSALEQMAHFNQAVALDSAHLPLFCISSPMFPVDTAAIRRHVPAFTLWIMKGVGHFVHQEDPATFNRDLEEAIRGTKKPPVHPKVKRHGHTFNIT
jgi:pimeloyl-ACP methyl ester carboxylesterase